MNTMRFGVATFHVFAMLSLASGTLLAADSLSEKMEAQDRTVPGWILTYSVEDSEEEGLRPWRHLQRFQIHLRELDTDNRLVAVGCDTNEEDFSCELLEGATRGNQPPGTKKVKELKYMVYDSDWVRGVGALFSDALSRTNVEKQEGVPSPEVVVKVVPEHFSEPACSDQYAQPCYTRAICTAFGGCSKSKFSCQQCNPK